MSIPLDQARDALRPAAPEDVYEAFVALIRQATVRSMFLAYLRDNRERYNEAVRRGDDLQERLTREQRECLERLNREQREAQDKLAREERDHAVTKTNLTNAGTRTAAQMLLQILGGAVFGWGLSEMSKTWAALLYLVIAVVLIAIGCMPIVTIPWWRRDRG